MEHENSSDNMQYLYEESGSLTSHDNNDNDNDNSNVDTSNLSESASITSTISRSKAWEHFIKSPDFKNDKKATCKYCRTTYTCSGSSTSNLIKHLEKTHPAKLNLMTDSSSIVNFFKAKVIFEIFQNCKKYC